MTFTDPADRDAFEDLVDFYEMEVQVQMAGVDEEAPVVGRFRALWRRKFEAFLTRLGIDHDELVIAMRDAAAARVLATLPPEERPH